MAAVREISGVRRAGVGATLLVSVWAVALWTAGRWHLDGWLVRAWLVAPTAACACVVALPWRVDPATRQGRTRLWVAIGVAVVLCIPGTLLLAFLIWALGPDCGVVANGSTRGRYVLVALALGVALASLPIAIVGRRAATFAVGGIPVGILALFGLMAAASNEPGWCLF